MKPLPILILFLALLLAACGDDEPRTPGSLDGHGHLSNTDDSAQVYDREGSQSAAEYYGGSSENEAVPSLPDDGDDRERPRGSSPDGSYGVQSVESAGVEEMHIEVSDRGYTPSEIVLKKGVETTLIFHGTGISECAQRVVAPEIGLNEEIEPGEETEADVTPETAGSFVLSCGKGGAFKGKITVTP